MTSEISQNVDHALTVHQDAVKTVQFSVGKVDDAGIRADNAAQRTDRAQQAHLATQEQRLNDAKAQAFELSQRDKAHEAEIQRRENLSEQRFREQRDSADRRFNSFRDLVGFMLAVGIILLSLVSFFAWKANSQLTQTSLELYKTRATSTAQANQINELKQHQMWNYQFKTVETPNASLQLDGYVPDGKMVIIWGDRIGVSFTSQGGGNLYYGPKGFPAALVLMGPVYIIHVDSNGWLKAYDERTFQTTVDRKNAFCTALVGTSTATFYSFARDIDCSYR